MKKIIFMAVLLLTSLAFAEVSEPVVHSAHLEEEDGVYYLAEEANSEEEADLIVYQNEVLGFVSHSKGTMVYIVSDKNGVPIPQNSDADDIAEWKFLESEEAK